MKTLASIEISLANVLEALGDRAEGEPMGADIRHDIRACIQAALAYRSAGDVTREELTELTDRAVAVKARAQAYLEARRAVEATEPSPLAQQALIEALRGPRDDETLEQCPACAGCPVCKDQRMVSVRVASAWRMP
jgi:hypothetical protein